VSLGDQVIKAARRIIRRGLELTGLIAPYYRYLERRLARAPSQAVDDGRPMPPPDLLVAVAGGAGQGWFSERGQADAAKFLALARAAGVEVDGAITVLDWGCGCGRIARWIAPELTARGGTFVGSDLNPRLVAWCAAHLPGRYFANGLRPPLDLPDAGVDLVYAHSVLTHLTEETAVAWLAELRRVLKPGAVAILTFHDETYAERWGPPEVRTGLARQPYFVWNQALEGSNYMSAWTTRARMAALANDAAFEVLDMLPGSAEVPEQAVCIIRGH
jgi:SAM-dependent methyltransferase